MNVELPLRANRVYWGNPILVEHSLIDLRVCVMRQGNLKRKAN